MIDRHFYFLKDEYFDTFKDNNLMKNKESIDGKIANRPCFYAFKDNNTNLYWLIPFSSKITKFKKIYQIKIEKYHRCDTIDFAYVLGYEKAFLIQNMCPTTEAFIENEYIDKNSKTPVMIDSISSKRIITKAKKVLTLERQGFKLLFTNALNIEKKLL